MVVDRVHAATVKALGQKDIADPMIAQGALIRPMTPAEVEAADVNRVIDTSVDGLRRLIAADRAAGLRSGQAQAVDAGFQAVRRAARPVA